MGLFDAIDATGSALSAERMRLDVTAENLANAQTVGYRRKEVALQSMDGAARPGSFGEALDRAAKGVQVTAIVEDQTPLRRVYDPGHPQADQQGYVEMPNVDTVTEMVELIGASRAYEANVTAMQTAKQLFTRTLDLLR
ncbi:flagellar basal body rod protein FlgC [Conexibacter sp. SYSU D00693]|uniref:flagellar basal body rod protein FlgC n=1 Tax=Conexibacter sp. SYSU D00693 TaxID=2812560 RepID=UPI00196AD9D2|nr:flagellar basal body rod protein FlgC [Conexibacter sp. SYSU D00693]